MKKVSKSVLKAKMFEYFRDLEARGGVLIVTDFGKPVLKIEPFTEKESVENLFAELRARARLPREVVLASTESEWLEK